LRRNTAIVLIVIAVAAVYANSFSGAFVFDDFPSIVENPHVRSLLPLSRSMSAPPEVTTAGRPVAAFSFAISYAQGAYDTWWYHAMNVAIHAAAALALFGIVRRTLVTAALRPSFGGSPTDLAFAIVLLWAIHPLHTQAVTYIVQRTESLMGLFFLLTLYAAIRHSPQSSSGFRLQAEGWAIVSIICCALGMATKQTMVGAPLLVIAWDYLFAPRMRWKFYAALASSWILLAYLVMHEMRPHSVGSIEGWTPLTYLLTQAGVIVHYLRLSVAPFPLVFDYDWRPARDIAEIALPVAVVSILVLFTVIGLVRRRPWAFAGAWFFIILAPTSSVLPIATEVAAEHRMYLPVAAVLAVLVFGTHVLSSRVKHQRLVAELCGVLLAAFCVQTVVRNQVYASDERIWEDTIARRPFNARAHNNYAVDLLKTGRPAEAETHARQATSARPEMAEAHQTLGVALLSQGKADEGIASLERALALDSTDGKIHQNLGEAYGAKGDLASASRAFLEAARYQPDDPFVLNRAAWILATAPDPMIRDGRRAVSLAEHAVAITGRQDVVSLDTLAAAYAETAQFDRAIATARDALSLARAKGESALIPELEQRLATYQARRPFHAD
jgi:hypothetical protein